MLACLRGLYLPLNCAIQQPHYRRLSDPSDLDGVFVGRSAAGVSSPSIADNLCLWLLHSCGEMGVIRATVMAPFLFFYFPRLAAAFPGTSAFAVARRIAADQILGSPVAISMVFIASSAIQGDITQAPKRIQQQLLPTWLNGLTYWPFAHTITFKFVPVAYQAHFANFLSVYWNMVLSYRANIKLQPSAAESVGDGSSTTTVQAAKPQANGDSTPR